jgi:hypothetical protein
MPKNKDGIAIGSSLKPARANPLTQKVWKKGKASGITRGTVNGLKFVTLAEGQSYQVFGSRWSLALMVAGSLRKEILAQLWSPILATW